MGIFAALSERVRAALGWLPPPWERPRAVWQLEDADIYAALKARLDQTPRQDDHHERERFYTDRETGQRWRGFDWDFEFTTNEELTPLSAPHSDQP